MRALLIAPGGWEKEGSAVMRLWPSDRTIPDGWVEVELENNSRFEDLCSCVHSRQDHERHTGHCMGKQCECAHFKEGE